MPGRSSLKDPKMYDRLRKEGASEEKAARISNAAAKQGRASVGRKGGKAGDYEEWSVDRLRSRAKDLGIRGYSGKRKSELIDMLRHH